VVEKEFSFKGKGLPITCHEGTAGGGMDLLILHHGSCCGWVVCVMSVPLYPWNRAQVLIVQEAGGGPRTGLDGCGDEEVSCPNHGLNPELSWL
jgi:hypothetical protein